MIGNVVKILYIYLYSHQTGDASVVNHNANIGTYTINSLYFFFNITYPTQTITIENTNPIFHKSEIIGILLY